MFQRFSSCSPKYVFPLSRQEVVVACRLLAAAAVFLPDLSVVLLVNTFFQQELGSDCIGSDTVHPSIAQLETSV